jgi:hypothetical protein
LEAGTEDNEELEGVRECEGCDPERGEAIVHEQLHIFC